MVKKPEQAFHTQKKMRNTVKYLRSLTINNANLMRNHYTSMRINEINTMTITNVAKA